MPVGLGITALIGVGAAGAAGAFAPDAPPSRDYAAETTAVLDWKIKHAAEQANAYADTNPLYTAANNRAAYDAIMGTRGGSREEQYVDMVATPEDTLDFNSALNRGYVTRTGGGVYGGGTYTITDAGRNAGYSVRGNDVYRAASTTPTLKTRTITGVDSPGLLSLYENDIAPVMNRTLAEAQRQQVEQNQKLLSQYGPSYLAALKAINPEQTALRDTLYGQVRDDLALRGQLDEGTRREIEQSTQGRWNSALAYSPEVAVQTRMNTGSAAEVRYRQRQDAAMRVIGLDQSLYGDPFLQITGRPSGTTAAAQNFLYQGQGTTAASNAATRGIFDPESPYAQDVYGSNQNAIGATNIAGANSRSGALSGLLGAGGSIIGGYYAGKKN